MIALINHAASLLGMPDPKAAFHHSRIAIIDYAQAYRGHRDSASLLDSAYLHLEKAVEFGADRDRIEEHFYRIRQRSIPVSH